MGIEKAQPSSYSAQAYHSPHNHTEKSALIAHTPLIMSLLFYSRRVEVVVRAEIEQIRYNPCKIAGQS